MYRLTAVAHWETVLASPEARQDILVLGLILGHMGSMGYTTYQLGMPCYQGNSVRYMYIKCMYIKHIMST